ncbi:cysteine proteinase inhibitor-like [Mercurialis annua]|uniref:cysteine proteinase inhibitor-like n=1 Tax=Mercurialis annua TaxID=3986 RepID=UPI00215F64D2|nr:cysteine proteinase inhibitor-like [Mercurialis annua]
MALVGGISEVEGSANSVEIDALARFAVDDYNNKQNALLEYKKVVNAKQQVVAGLMHYLTLEVMDGGHKKLYEAKIWEKLWLNFKEVQHFKLVGDAPSATSS